MRRRNIQTRRPKLFRRVCVVAWLLLCAFLLPVGAVAEGSGALVSLSTPCTVTVRPCGQEDRAFAADVATAKVRVDLYRVAEAQANVGADGFRLTPVTPFEGLSIPSSPTADQWRRLAKAAGAVAFGQLDTLTPAYTGMADEAISGLSAGLYVAIAHGDDITNYVQTEGETTLTVARSARYTYLYEPELVLLPARKEGRSVWQYSLTVTLKPERAQRSGGVEVVKTLSTLTVGEKATFVFRVAVDDRPARVYALDFSEAGRASFRLEELPAGASVTVTEVYSGASFRLTTPQEQTVTVAGDEVATVSFTNEYVPSDRTGYGILNRFVYAADGWQWNNGGGRP